MKISISYLKKYYKDKLALDIEGLNIHEGKITGIYGPNGSGKTTLLRIISGLDKKFEGNVRFNEKILDKYILQNITLVFQRPHLLKRKVYDNIDYPLKIRNVNKSDRQQKIKSVIDRLEINQIKNNKANQLSGGESQKIALARALVFEPKLLLLDEPTSNIDTASTRIIEREILRYNKENQATIIVITHDLDQAKRMCDEIIYMQDGKVVI